MGLIDIFMRPIVTVSCPYSQLSAQLCTMFFQACFMHCVKYWVQNGADHDGGIYICYIIWSVFSACAGARERERERARERKKERVLSFYLEIVGFQNRAPGSLVHTGSLKERSFLPSWTPVSKHVKTTCALVSASDRFTVCVLSLEVE